MSRPQELVPNCVSLLFSHSSKGSFAATCTHSKHMKSLTLLLHHAGAISGHTKTQHNSCGHSKQRGLKSAISSEFPLQQHREAGGSSLTSLTVLKAISCSNWWLAKSSPGAELQSSQERGHLWEICMGAGLITGSHPAPVQQASLPVPELQTQIFTWTPRDPTNSLQTWMLFRFNWFCHALFFTPCFTFTFFTKGSNCFGVHFLLPYWCFSRWNTVSRRISELSGGKRRWDHCLMLFFPAPGCKVETKR